MIEFFEYTFSSFWRFVGVDFEIGYVAFCLALIAYHLGKIGRPRKKVINVSKNF